MMHSMPLDWITPLMAMFTGVAEFAISLSDAYLMYLMDGVSCEMIFGGMMHFCVDTEENANSVDSMLSALANHPYYMRRK